METPFNFVLMSQVKWYIPTCLIILHACAKACPYAATHAATYAATYATTRLVPRQVEWRMLSKLHVGTIWLGAWVTRIMHAWNHQPPHLFTLWYNFAYKYRASHTCFASTIISLSDTNSFIISYNFNYGSSHNGWFSQRHKGQHCSICKFLL